MMDQMIRQFVAEQKFMGCALVAKDDRVLLKKSYGFANLEWDIQNSPETKMQIASVTKQFTAAAILLLQDRGELFVNDPVKKYLPDSPAIWDKITIFHLLTHTSGLHNYTDSDVDDYFKPMRTIACTPEKLTELFSSKPLEFEPGEKIAYSNSGYVLLGRIIEKISGQSYASFLQKNIFDPLDMRNSGNDSRDEILKQRASGYDVCNGKLINTDLFDIALCFAGGSLYSTVDDLHKWVRGLFGGKLLSASSLQKMITPFRENYGFGLTVMTENGRKVIKHKGKTPGFKSVVSYYPVDKLIVVVLTNNEKGSAAFEIARMLAAIAHGEKIISLQERKEVEVPPETLTTYVGEYKLNSGQILEIFPLSDKLMAWTKDPDEPSAPLRDTCWLSAESNRRFFSRDHVNLNLEFFYNDQGKVSHLILAQGQASLKAVRQ